MIFDLRDHSAGYQLYLILTYLFFNIWNIIFHIIYTILYYSSNTNASHYSEVMEAIRKISKSEEELEEDLEKRLSSHYDWQKLSLEDLETR